VIPPQKAAAIAASAGAADRTGWCPIEPIGFESTLQPGIHVLGDAALTGAMPKSAFAANAQAKVCAAAIVAKLGGKAGAPPPLANTCYSLVAPGYGISTSGAYHPENGQLLEIAGSGVTSPLDAPDKVRAAEAGKAASWFDDITAETFG
jgi:sulfide dehydrogenase [flavocytochrome c] flavoprotein chain